MVKVDKKGAKVLHRHLRGNVLLCEEKSKKGIKTHFLFFPKRNAHMWITIEKMKEIVDGFEELIKIKGSKKNDKHK